MTVRVPLGYTHMRRLALSVLFLIAGAASASAVDTTGLPLCDDPAVLDRVTATFAAEATNVEKRDLKLVSFGKIKEQKVTGAPSPIVRRWCSAPVKLSDGTRSTAWWRLDRGVGFAAHGYAGIPDGIEVCVAGHDRWTVHDGACRTVRHWW